MDVCRFVRVIRKTLPCLAAGIALCATVALAQPLPFFSGAEGYGGTWSGAVPPGGIFSGNPVPAAAPFVYHVTNLNDSGPGSFRGAFAENSSNKIIVFDVAGTINLTSDSLDIKNLSNYYIAGQTAPGPVTIYGDMAQLTHSSGKENRNVVLRYLSFRKGTGNNSDSITFAGSGLGTNLILDHVSASWSEDEILSVANNNTNVTVQYSIIHDALVNNHAYGSLIRPRIDSNVTFHHNLYAHNASRQARFGTYEAETLTADFRNNVVYNFRDRASYAGGSSESEQEFADINYVGNYIIAGPGTTGTANRAFSVDKNVDARVYQSGNFVDSDKAVNPGGVPNGSDLGWGAFAVSTPVTDQTLTQMASPFATAPVTTQTAPNAYSQILQHVGNYWWQRDAIDTRVINNVKNNTGPTIGAAEPNATELTALTTAPVISRPTGWDTDNDGMPDHWEVAHGLNAGSAADNKLDFDSDGYINILEYLDEAGAFPAPAPIVFNGATSNRFAAITNWKTDDGITAGSNWQPSRFDEARINSGTVVVDAAGQHAGVLKVGAVAGESATLNITSGWIEVASQLIVGADPAATAVVNLSGGVLSAPTIDKGTGGTFNFTGGKLHADTVNFDLVNNGGTIAPGHSVGQTHVAGDLTLNSGTLEIELGSISSADSLLVDGDATLAGNLNILTLGGFTPTLGNNWQIIDADHILNQFTSITAGYSVQKQGDTLRLYFGPAPPIELAGDFNQDGTVDAADYAVWRAGLGTTYDQDDYNDWQTNFGATNSGAAAGAADFSNTAVPEPTTWIMFALSVVAARCARARRRIS
jgi:hypothetical protein